jgi:hypothetical protein
MCHVPGDVNPQQHRRETSYIDLVLLIIAKGIPTLLISFVSNVSAQHPSHVSYSQNLLWHKSTTMEMEGILAYVE